MRLNYNRAKLIGAAAVCLVGSLMMLLIATLPLEGRRGPLGVIVAILGPTGAQVFLVLLGLICGLGAVRMLWLTFDGALAVRIEPRGIRVRSIYFIGFLPWSAVRGVDARPVAMWGNRPVLVIDRTDEAGLLLRLSGQRDKLVIPSALLAADEYGIEAWMAAAEDRGGPVPAPVRQAPQPGAPQRPVFGRRQ